MAQKLEGALMIVAILYRKCVYKFKKLEDREYKKNILAKDVKCGHK